MLNFISTLSIFLLIFLEIALTIFCVKKMQILETKVNEMHLKMLENAKKILEINDEVKKTIKKTNKIIKILSNKKLHQIRKIIMMIVDIIQLIMLIKSLESITEMIL